MPRKNLPGRYTQAGPLRNTVMAISTLLRSVPDVHEIRQLLAMIPEITGADLDPPRGGVMRMAGDAERALPANLAQDSISALIGADVLLQPQGDDMGVADAERAASERAIRPARASRSFFIKIWSVIAMTSNLPVWPSPPVPVVIAIRARQRDERRRFQEPPLDPLEPCSGARQSASR